MILRDDDFFLRSAAGGKGGAPLGLRAGTSSMTAAREPRREPAAAPLALVAFILPLLPFRWSVAPTERARARSPVAASPLAPVPAAPSAPSCAAASPPSGLCGPPITAGTEGGPERKEPLRDARLEARGRHMASGDAPPWPRAERRWAPAKRPPAKAGLAAVAAAPLVSGWPAPTSCGAGPGLACTAAPGAASAGANTNDGAAEAPAGTCGGISWRRRDTTRASRDPAGTPCIHALAGGACPRRWSDSR
mmetsp:Transcript_2087/g.5894  ORF Transcript_2087/g.5894 Transcript_2087/m.5894 type:complete len:249 (+) Transcript_2087:705-1451(+)